MLYNPNKDLDIHGFTGHSYDPVLEVYFAQARMYDPQAKRFMTEDPARDGENWYIYCYDNPVNLVDPDGQAPTVATTIYVACKMAIAAYTVYQVLTYVVPPLAKSMEIYINNVKFNCYIVSNISQYKDAKQIGFVQGNGYTLIKTYGELLEEIDKEYNVVDTIVNAVSDAFTSLGDACSDLFKSAEASGELTAQDIGKIANKYGNEKCVEAKKDIVKYLEKNKKSYEIIEIQYPSRPGYVVSNLHNDRVISQNGYHVGVLYDGLVYCNVHPFGLSLTIWLNDFEGYGDCRVTPSKYQSLKRN